MPPAGQSSTSPEHVPLNELQKLIVGLSWDHHLHLEATCVERHSVWCVIPVQQCVRGDQAGGRKECLAIDSGLLSEPSLTGFPLPKPQTPRPLGHFSFYGCCYLFSHHLELHYLLARASCFRMSPETSFWSIQEE